MVKTLKKKEQAKSDEIQPKISSFFENQANGKKESKLFTKISSTSNRNPGRPALAKDTVPKSVYREKPARPGTERKSNNCFKERVKEDKGTAIKGKDDVVFIDLEDEFSSAKKVILNSVKDESHQGECSESEAHKIHTLSLGKDNESKKSQNIKTSKCEGERETHNDQVAENKLKVKSGSDILSLCNGINRTGSENPATRRENSGQDQKTFSSTFATPEKSKGRNDWLNTSAESSPDIICETPDVNRGSKDAAKRKWAISSRSFLCPRDLITVQPGQKPPHLKMKHGRGARRLLGKVSVSFNDKSGFKNEPSFDSEAPEKVSFAMQAPDNHFMNRKNGSCTNSEDNQTQSPYTKEECNAAKTDDSKEMEIEHENTGELATESTTLSIPETQLLEDIANEIVEEIDMETKNKSSLPFSQIMPVPPVKVQNNFVNMEEHIHRNTVFVDCKAGSKISLVREMPTLTNKILPNNVARAEKNIFHSETQSIRRTKSDNVGSLQIHPFKETKSKSKLINALEEADDKAEETEENIWMGERLMKHFAEDDHILDSVSIAVNHEQNSDTTPVKKYGKTTIKCKRLSKPGLSPASKRQPSKCFTDLKDVERLETLNLNDSSKKVLFNDNVGDLPEPQCSKSKLTEKRAYQFGLKKKENVRTDDKKVTLEDDSVLTELLGELNSSSNKPTHQPTIDVLKEIRENAIGSLAQKDNFPANSNENNGFHRSLLMKNEPNDEEFLDKLFGKDDFDADDIVKEIEMSEKKDETTELNKYENVNAKTDKQTIASLNICKEEIITIMDSESTENRIEGDEENTDCIILDANSADFNQHSITSVPISIPQEVPRNNKEHENKTQAAKSPTYKAHQEIEEHPRSGKLDGKYACGGSVSSCSNLHVDANAKHSMNMGQICENENYVESASALPANDSRVLPNKASAHDEVMCHTSTITSEEVTGIDVENQNEQNGNSNNEKPIVGGDFNQNPDLQYEDWPSFNTTELSASICDKLSLSFGSDISVPSDFKKPEITVKLSRTNKAFRFTDLWNRFTVVEVMTHRVRDEVHLRLHCDKTGKDYQCILRGFWADTVVNKNDTVNIIGNFQEDVCIIDDRDGLIIVNPDQLLSGTLVVSSLFCARKSVLNEKFKGVDSGNIQMLYGSIIHSLFQTVMKEGIRGEKALLQEAKALLKSNKFLHEMYGQNVQETSVIEEISQYIPSLLSWLQKHTSTPETLKYGTHKPLRSDLLVTEICDIEENIWSPRFGLKGKIDMTVKAKLRKTGTPDTEKILPLELKTGKASFSAEHKGQVTLYSMMYSDRREDPGEGILLYLKHGEMEIVPVKPESKSGLIQMRNRLADYLTRQVQQDTADDSQKTFHLGGLPEPLNSQRACSKCAHLLSCSIYQRSVEQTVHSEKHAMATMVPEALQHLENTELDYFTHWILCLDLESQESRKMQQSQIWCSSSTEREQTGDCISNLIISSSELGMTESQSFNEGKGCSLTFRRHPSYCGPSLVSVGLVCNDMVVISSEDGQYIALATGFIRKLSPDLVEVVVDRDYLYNTSAYTKMKFRLDRHDSMSASGLLYTNLVRLMEQTPQAKHLRNLVVKKQAPQFELKLSKSCIQKVKPLFRHLNKPQRAAVLKVLMAKDYVLIKGFPGTGKTSTIVALVKILQLIGKSVLLTSYTHSAVDNILLKLKEDHVPFLRLGRRARIHPTILPHAAEVLTSSSEINSVQKLKEFYESYDIVATSCLGMNHPIFNQRKFDVCIVDEASQVLQSACLGPLFHCHKFVLVGDPQQLPPLVQSKEARKLGMDESLFTRLDKCGATYDLYLQYRMNRCIMELCNRLVYEGKLQCGNQDVAEECVSLSPASLPEDPPWMKHVLNPELEKSVIFVDTQPIGAREAQHGKGLINETEADLVMSILKAAVDAHVECGSLGVMSPYRSQVKLIQQKVHNCPEIAAAEVNTVDQYQGRDKSVIIVSFVRSQTDNMGELLKDLRRLNVAFTRARHKLILIGNAEALRSYEYLASTLEWLETTKNLSFCIV